MKRQLVVLIMQLGIKEEVWLGKYRITEFEGSCSPAPAQAGYPIQFWTNIV